MKNLVFIIVAIVGLAACDKVDDPYADVKKGPNIGLVDSTFNDTTYSDSAAPEYKRIVIEDFTGHKCINCPKATDIGEDLMEKYPGIVLVIALHNSGTFSKPDPPDYPDNYETEEGEELRVKYQFSEYPIGLVNRMNLDTSNTSKGVSYNVWESEIDHFVSDQNYIKPDFSIKAMNIYNTESKSVTVFPEVEALDNLTGDFNLVINILENGIISPQDDSRKNPAYVPDYEHNHMLRAMFPNGRHGKNIFTNPQTGDAFVEGDGIQFLLEDEWVPENCDLVILITNQDTEEIVHAEQFHLTPKNNGS